MGFPVNFPGVNRIMKPPKGEEDRCGDLPIFNNGSLVISCWEFTEEEFREIVETKKVFVSTWSNGIVFPQYVGDSNSIRALSLDFGKPLPKEI